MTHSNHRQGTYDSLSDDFVVLGFVGREFDDVRATLTQFADIGLRHQPVNVPNVKSWSCHLVYDSKEKVRNVLADLAAAGLGLSITVSGLRDQVAECCRAVGIRPHTVCQSFGFWGKTERLPHSRVLEVSTMCGHGRISPNLVWDLAGQVQHGALNAGEASKRMGRLCLCNIFNEVRAARLLGKLAADLEAGTISALRLDARRDVAPKDFGITIDEAKCIGCMDCIPYCPVSAIVESVRGTVGIDAGRCTECGVCLQAQVCPVDAIVARELTWPRTLRGKFHSLYAPYRVATTSERVSRPAVCPGEGQIYSGHRHGMPTELTNDVHGFFRPGETEIMAELGRPHLGTTFLDVQKVIQALLPLGLKLEEQYAPLDERSPLTDLTADAARGILRQDILRERTGWVFLKLTVPDNEVLGVLHGLRRAAAEIDSVFAVDAIACVLKDTVTAADRVAGELGIAPAPNCKTNVGLGRPLAQM